MGAALLERTLALGWSRHQRVTGTENSLAEFDLEGVLDESADVPQAVARAQELELLSHAIQSLPTRCRQIITLRKIYGLSQREVAAELGISREIARKVVNHEDGKVDRITVDTKCRIIQHFPEGNEVIPVEAVDLELIESMGRRLTQHPLVARSRRDGRRRLGAGGSIPGQRRPRGRQQPPPEGRGRSGLVRHDERNALQLVRADVGVRAGLAAGAAAPAAAEGYGRCTLAGADRR